MADKVCCREVEVDMTKEMNERDYLVDILSNEKDIVKNMSVALTEASNIKLHEELLTIFDEVRKLQVEAYELAWNMGWYKLEESSDSKILQTKKEMQKKYNELTN